MSEFIPEEVAPDAPFDGANPKHVRDRAQKERRDQIKRDNFLSAAMDQQEGRDFLWWFLSQCGMYQNPFAVNALVMANKAGMMNAGQILLAEIVRVAPEAYVSMLKERMNE